MTEMPTPIKDFNQYMIVIKGRSKRTVEQYDIDLCLFFRYIISSREKLPLDEESIAAVDISHIDSDYVGSVTKSEVMEFFSYAAINRENNARVRARKLSSLRSFYKYHCDVKMDVSFNPVMNIDSPKLSKTLPKHLSVEESIELLNSVSSNELSKTKERDFAILTIFLNCGLRLSELVGIDLSDIDRDFTSMRITGKGSKERVVYLNDACKTAIKNYLKVRNSEAAKPEHKNALFLSSQHRRISPKTVQFVVYKYLSAAGLEYRHLSTHKLRHTAATLMYQTGNVDIRVLKDILGHEQLNTTQIYTHVSNEDMKKAAYQNPLANVKLKRSNNEKE